MHIVFSIAMLLLELIKWSIFIRAILSWFYPVGRDPVTRVLVDLTEPLIAPVRAVLSRVLPIPIDFSPMVIFFLIILLQNMLTAAYRT